ncbi:MULTISPECIES: N-acetylmuramic acid 6-phosphate etherase [unclassified Devosia]|uniref:N-acetylmuramic acid 6-phosphate etherase n=1 Tax=unclassified Devosia TaxID=196773 RepID=UPI00145D71C9|nr:MULTISPECIES: N-acetylmuramic acid 6-phosphate etherase [unclassified Devosia]MBJ6988112.1 N-acetylmuramic acid 6-phosphate etherase [Devosia sp. MC521]MBJ7577683.1 N-acetylmuramic acid 6-phosphate etherase [Devosia sp. MC532]MBK1794387.1 N-acetylmuramic acid 6-phosphate etherase [Devosia sp. WQ 349K1]QMW63398.1 N-acetylmuramic acid 6-phosphate etherase [Devosia sp. MC521]
MSKSTLIAELEHLVSEARNPETMQIDLMSTEQILAAMNAQDAKVAEAVRHELPQIAQAVDRIVDAFRKGGRLIYMGAGTSGRLGVLDASECPPTFGVPDTMVVGIIAGGDTALRYPIEGAEDDRSEGQRDLVRVNATANDVVVGIAVSGRTPYVIGALDYAKSLGAVTVSLTCNPNSPIANMADIAISPLVGPESLTGSTRLKSGTAQKLVLNMLTTASMIRIGKSYENLMVDVSVSNEKLAARAVRIIGEVTGLDTAEAEIYLDRSGNNVKLAILMALTGLDKDAATTALTSADGFLRRAVSENKAD